MEQDELRLGGRVQVVSEQSPARRFGKQITMSVIASLIAGLILNFSGIKDATFAAVRYLCATVTHLWGDPITGEGGVVDQAKKKADEYRQRYAGKGQLPLPGSLHKTPEQIEAEAKARREEQERRDAKERATLIARAAPLGLVFDDSWPLERLRIEVPAAERRARDAAERPSLLKQAAELALRVDEEWDNDTLKQKLKLAVKRKPLLAEAAELQMVVDEEWDNDTLKEEIKEERAFQKVDSDYQDKKRKYQHAMEEYREFLLHGPNSRCPSRSCGHVFRLGYARTGKFVCPKCAGHYLVSTARACFKPPPPPKEPQPPKRGEGWFKRMLPG